LNSNKQSGGVMAYKKILVPLDGSELAEKALPYAKRIAKIKKSALTLYAVSLKIFVDRRDRLFTSYLEATAKTLNDEGLKTDTDTGYGDVAEQIIKYANSNNMDLIIMATHGYSRAKRWMFGSITQKVLYGTAIPVLLIKSKSPEVRADFKKILVPVDGSPFSESTLPYVEDLARNTKSEILLLHICEPPVVPSYGSKPINSKWKKYREEMWEEAEKLATNYLNNKTAELKKKRLKVQSRVVKAETGEVARIILQIAKDEDIDLIATATQGRSGVSRLVYGSVANTIVEESLLPALLIRPDTTLPLTQPENLLDDIWYGYISNKT
jgi:nucleotide-binding universal stress UspA family protein